MTVTHTFTRYESNACMDREDAEALGEHLMVLATALASSSGRLDLAGANHDTNLHYARLVRIVQRATQPDVVGRAACPGVEKLMLTIDDGRRTITVRTPQADIVVDLDRRSMSLEPRGSRENRVVPIAPYLEKRA